MEHSDWAVDNASLDTTEDQHPCGGKHTYTGGVCEDCGEKCDHEDVIYAHNVTWSCLECDLDFEMDEGDFGWPTTQKEKRE